MTHREKIIGKIVRAINNNDPSSEVYLYGSRARGDAKELSDWDLLILLSRKEVPLETEIKFMDDLYEVELETGEAISPLIYSKSDWNTRHHITPLYQNIKKEGIRLK